MNNLITSNADDGILIASGAASVGAIFGNSLSGNNTSAGAFYALDNQAAGTLTTIYASGDWWGSNTEAGVQSAINSAASIHYTPWLDASTNVGSPATGFLGDFTKLDVGAGGQPPLSGGRINEAIGDLTAGGTIKVNNGTYTENVIITKALTLESVNGAASTIITDASGTTGTIAISTGLSGATIGVTGKGFTLDATFATRWALIGNGTTPVTATGNIFQSTSITATLPFGNVKVSNTSGSFSGNTFTAPSPTLTAASPNFEQYLDSSARDTGTEISGLLANNTFNRAVTVGQATTPGYIRTIWANIGAAVTAAVPGDYVNPIAATYVENVTIPANVTLAPGGKGTIAAVTITGSLAFSSGSGLQMDVNLGVAGTTNDELVVSGTVNLSGATVTLTGTGSTAPTQRVVLINNTSGSATTAGTSPAGGGIFTLGGYAFAISYAGGSDISGATSPDPDDVVLLIVPNVTVNAGTYVYNKGPEVATATATKPSDGSSVTPSPSGFTFTYSGSGTAPVDAGTYPVVASFTSGDDNYANTSSSGASLTITPATVTVTGLAASKIYDGGTTASLNYASAVLHGVFSGDATPPGPGTVALQSGGGTGTFASPDAGSNITVNVVGLALMGLTADGTAATVDYTLVQPTTTANITPKTLTVTGITAGPITYDGGTTASLTTTGATLTGVVTGDATPPGPGSVSLVTTGATGSFASPDVANGVMVQVAGLTLTGTTADGTNATVDYTLIQPTTTANITPATLTVNGITAANKTYDGTTTASLITTGATLAGVISDDATPPGPGSVSLVTTGATAPSLLWMWPTASRSRSRA